jgi:hypothetical protein
VILKALFITGSNQYGVVSHFIQGMQVDLGSMNVQIYELDVGSQQSLEKTLRGVEPLSKYDFIVSFNAVGLDTVVGGESIADHANKRPTFVFLVDHPIHLLKRFIGLDVKVLCVDQEHVAFCQLCQIKAIYFPHAISQQYIDNQDKLSYEQKQDEVIFPVSFFDMKSAQTKLKPVWHQISTIVDKSPNITRFMQLLGVLPMGNRPATVQLDENIQRICIFADLYIRGRLRNQFLRECSDNNLKLSVVGRGSLRYQEAFPLHQYSDAIPFEQLLQRMSAARYVAHNSPGFENGLHERVIYPLALGSLVVCDLPFVKNQFMSAIRTTHNASQVDADTFQKLSLQAQLSIQQQHTWRARWEPLLKQF